MTLQCVTGPMTTWIGWAWATPGASPTARPTAANAVNARTVILCTVAVPSDGAVPVRMGHRRLEHGRRGAGRAWASVAHVAGLDRLGGRPGRRQVRVDDPLAGARLHLVDARVAGDLPVPVRPQGDDAGGVLPRGPRRDVAVHDR